MENQVEKRGKKVMKEKRERKKKGIEERKKVIEILP